MTTSATALPATPAWLDRWAAFASGLQFGDLPAAVVARSRQVLFDSVGAIAAGAQEAETRGLTERLAALGGTGGFAVPVIGAHLRLPAGTAALIDP
jgi:2-methylcitrate dehydratase PrpD